MTHRRNMRDRRRDKRAMVRICLKAISRASADAPFPRGTEMTMTVIDEAISHHASVLEKLFAKLGEASAEEMRDMETYLAQVGPCPKCGESSGNNWSQCEGACPMPMSPHHKAPLFANLYDRMLARPARELTPEETRDMETYLARVGKKLTVTT